MITYQAITSSLPIVFSLFIPVLYPEAFFSTEISLTAVKNQEETSNGKYLKISESRENLCSVGFTNLFFTCGRSAQVKIEI
ncbi:unnamed protein product [Thlaspi arvense]|uniref:Secreted protein n=1 Tax=Thlaspi arvense TaxID=13288 RepID=A0AAU9T6M0_THLAR|nr:unnamed protein product [Thlaspi arvense]